MQYVYVIRVTLHEQCHKPTFYPNTSMVTKIKSRRIAQRNGRTKDGLIKRKGVENVVFERNRYFSKFEKTKHCRLPYLMSLNLDRMKAREVVLTKQNKIYIKEDIEDYRSITTGIFSYKGRVHLEFDSIDKFFKRYALASATNNFNTLPT